VSRSKDVVPLDLPTAWFFLFDRGEERRRRFRGLSPYITFGTRRLDLSVLGPKLYEGHVFYYENLPAEAKKYYFYAASKFLDIPQNWQPRWKELTSHIKLGGSASCPTWEYLVELETIGWNLPVIPLEKFEHKVKDWLGGEYVVEPPGFIDFLNNDLVDILTHTFKYQVPVSETVDFGSNSGQYSGHLEGVNDTVVPIQEFSKYLHKYATSGAAEYKTDKYLKSKWAAAAEGHFSKYNILDHHHYRYYTQIKPERGKLRQFGTDSNISYLQMSAWMHYVERAFLGHSFIRVFNNGVESRLKAAAQWKRMRYLWPLDASKFDHLQSIPQLSAIIRSVTKAYQIVYGKVEDMDALATAIIFGISHASIRLDRKDKWMPVKGGILSGWRITSLIGSLWNMSIHLYINKLNGFDWTKAELDGWNFFGDDAVLTFDDKLSLGRHGVISNDLGYTVNPRKGWVSDSGRS
jgi:hypothetical protein